MSYIDLDDLMHNDLKKLHISASQAARELGITRRALMSILEFGVIPHTKSKCRILIRRDDLARYRRRAYADYVHERIAEIALFEVFQELENVEQSASEVMLTKGEPRDGSNRYR